MVPSQTVSTMTNLETIVKEHKLKHRWHLWAHLPQDVDWTFKSYKNVCKFETVEETIGIVELLPPDLVKNCMLFIMKDGIAPMWEDPKNRNGGCFSYKVSNKNVVETWKELTYLMCGETLSLDVSFVNSITGITISPKKNFCIIKIWLTNCDHQNPNSIINELKYLTTQGCLFKKHMPEF